MNLLPFKKGVKLRGKNNTMTLHRFYLPSFKIKEDKKSAIYEYRKQIKPNFLIEKYRNATCIFKSAFLVARRFVGAYYKVDIAV